MLQSEFKTPFASPFRSSNPLKKFSRPAGLHLPGSLHDLYAATVTSVRSMQYELSVIECAGFSLSSARGSLEPMKNSPPSILIMPVGHAGATGTAETEADGADVDATGVGTGFVFPNANTATAPPAASATRTPMSTPRPPPLFAGTITGVCVAVGTAV